MVGPGRQTTKYNKNIDDQTNLLNVLRAEMAQGRAEFQRNCATAHQVQGKLTLCPLNRCQFPVGEGIGDANAGQRLGTAVFEDHLQHGADFWDGQYHPGLRLKPFLFHPNFAK